MLLGYARVSTDDQRLDLQIAALTAAGVEPDRIYTDTASGARANRPGLLQALKDLRAGDVLVIWRLDRLGRSLRDLIDLADRINQAGAGPRSLTEAIDTTTPTGEMVFHFMGAIAQFERALIRERTMAGLKVAREKGRRGGRPAKLPPRKLAIARTLLAAPDMTSTQVAEQLGVSRATLYRALKRASED